MDVLQISTEDLPPADRVETFRELFGRKILKIDIEPAPNARFEAAMTLQAMPGLGIGAVSLSPLRSDLTAELIDNDDRVTKL